MSKSIQVTLKDFCLALDHTHAITSILEQQQRPHDIQTPSMRELHD